MLRDWLCQCEQDSGMRYSSPVISPRGKLLALGQPILSRRNFAPPVRTPKIYPPYSPVYHDNSSKIALFTASPDCNEPLLQHRPARFKLSSQLIRVMPPV